MDGEKEETEGREGRERVNVIRMNAPVGEHRREGVCERANPGHETGNKWIHGGRCARGRFE